MLLRDRLRSVPRRRWLAAVVVLAVVTGTAGVVAAWPDDESAMGRRAAPSATATATRPEAPAIEPRGPVSAASNGFEAKSLAAAGWRVSGTGAASIETGDAARNGRRALSLEAPREASRPTRLRLARIPVGQGLACDVGAWARDVTREQRLEVAFLGADGSPVGGEPAATGTSDPSGSADPSGTSATVATATTGSPVWSRATVRATSPRGTTQLQVTITAGAGSSGYWDDVDVTCPLLPDAGFERAGDRPEQPRGWSVVAGEGTSARRVQAPDGGGHLLEVRDGSATAGVVVRSQPTPVPPGLEVTVSARVRLSEGRQQVVVRFLDAARRPLGHLARLPVDTAPGQWELWSAPVSVPSGARWATVEVASDLEGGDTGGAAGGGASVGSWDDVAVSPATPASRPIQAAEAVSGLSGYLNTNTSGTTVVDGRTLLYTVVSGDPAELQVADLETGRLLDRHVLPGAAAAWAVVTSPDQRSVYLGGASGHLLRYDPVGRSLTDLGRATTQAQVVFGLAVGADGRVWGGSYPGGELWVHDPRRKGFTTIAPLRGGHEYARSLAIEGQTLYVGTGSVNPSIISIDLRDPAERQEIALPGAPRSGFVTELRSYGRLLAAKLPDGARGVYDLERSTWDTPVSKDATGRQLAQSPSTVPTGQPFYYFSNGLLWRVHPDRPDATAKVPVARTSIPPGRDRFVVRATLDGTTSDWLVSYDGSRSVVAIDVGALADGTDGADGQDLPQARWLRTTLALDPQTLRIKSLGAGADGVLWAGGFGGASLSSLDTNRPAAALTPRVGGVDTGAALLGFGEVEGLASSGPYEFFGTYTGARIFRFDTRQPWVDGKNPAPVAHLGPSWGQDRPGAWATSADRTYFGTIPRYGRRGGVLGWFEGDSTTPTVVPSPVADQSIVGLAASGSVVFGATSRWGGLGVGPTAAGAVVFAYDTEQRRVLWTSTLGVDLQSAGSVLLDGSGRLFALTRSVLVELDRSDGSVVRRFPLGLAGGGERATFADTDLAEGGGRLWAVTPDGLWAVDTGSGAFTRVADRGIRFPRVEFLADAAYYSAGRTLMKVAVP